MKRIVSGIMLTLLLTNILAFAFNFQAILISEASEPPSIEWSKTYGGTDSESATSVVLTSDGGYALAGYTSAQSAYGFYLVKTDSAGIMQWNKTYGGVYAHSMVLTSDGGYALAGYTGSYNTYDVYFVKTDSAGNMQWIMTYGGTGGDHAYSVVQTSDGGYALAGRTDSYGAGGDDVYLVKTDSAGIMQWNKTYGGTGGDYAKSVVQTSDGGYALAGGTGFYGAGGYDAYLVKTDSAGNMQWNMTYGGTGSDLLHSVVLTSDGGYALAGATFSYGAGDADVYLVKTDSAGIMQWNKTYGGTDVDSAESMVLTSDGGYALAGGTGFYNTYDVYLVKTDSAGNMQWNMTYGGTGREIAASMVLTSDGGYALAGITDSYGAGNDDFWLVKVAGSTIGTIYIRADGSIDPPTAPIQRNGDVYTLTEDTASDFDGIVVERNNTIIDGNGHTVKGTSTYESEGIVLSRRENVTVRNTHVTAFFFGIDFSEYSSCNIAIGNNITNCSYAILLALSSNNSVVENNIANNECGIELDSSSNSSISGNSITNNDCGVWLGYSSCYNTVSGNNVADNNYGVRLHSSSYYNSVSGNNITNNSRGVGLGRDTSNNTVSGNTIKNNDWDAVWLYHSSNNTVSGNMFVNDGLSVYFSYGNVVTGNLVNGRPLVYLEEVSDYVVEDAGQVILVKCNNVTVENLCLSNTTAGVELWETNNTRISGNNITNNDFGVFLGPSSSNTVLGNNIANNVFGVWLESYSSSNLIYHNNFINSFRPGFPSNSMNVWDDGYPSGGNYWSDYAGVDIFSGPYQNETGRDMIGDSPYVIEAITDHYPLMGPWTHDGENVTVTHASGISLAFSNVTSGGVTTVSQTEAGPDLPSGFKLATNPPAYYDIETTANYSGTIKISILYNDAGLTQEQESNLSLMHWNEALQQWTNITTLVDTENNIIYGETDSFSLFALITSIYGPGDLNKDRTVDIFDVTIVALAFSSTPSDPNWNPVADINNDGIVDIFDIVVVAIHFGETG